MAKDEGKLLEWDELPEEERNSLSDINYIKNCLDKQAIIDRINQLSRRCKDKISAVLNNARREDAKKAKTEGRACIVLDKDILASLGLEWDDIKPDRREFLTDFKNLRDPNLKSEILACINLMSEKCRRSMLTVINKKISEEMMAAMREHKAPVIFPNREILGALGSAQANFGLRDSPTQGKEK